MGTYRLRVPASRVGYVPEAQGGLPPGPRVPVRTGYAYQPQALGTYSVPWQPRRWLARLLLPDLFEVIEFYRTSTETTDVPALQAEFPGLLTSFAAFLDETGWVDPELTYDDLRAAGCVAVD